MEGAIFPLNEWKLFVVSPQPNTQALLHASLMIEILAKYQS